MVSKKSLASGLIFLLAFSCSEKNDQPSIAKESKTASPKITVLANLPDSIKPVKILLKKPIKRIKAGRPTVYAFLDSTGYMPPEEQAAGLFSNYTTDDGLALDAVRCSAVDKDGNLWFGTDGGGVSRYDGQTFTNFTIAHGLPANVVAKIWQDRSGDLWFSTPSGLSRFDGKSFTNYTTGEGLTNKWVTSFADDNSGKLWLGTWGGGLSSYDGEKFINLTSAQGLANDSVTAMMADKSGNLWIGTGNGISHYNGKRFINYTPPQLRNQIITSIAEDNQNNIWVGTGNGIFRYHAAGFSSDSAVVKFLTTFITCVTKDRAGNLWIGTTTEGVIRYDGSTFTRFTTRNGLPANKVSSITEDKTGNFWFGTDGGIIRYGGKSFMNYTAAHGLGDYFVFGMMEDNAGNLWFGNSGGGVIRYDGKSFSTYTTSQGLAHNQARPLMKDQKGNLWITTSGGGVNCFDGKSFTNYTEADGLGSNIITCITETGNGKIWFGTNYRGATCYDGNSFTNYSAVHGLPDNYIWCITEDMEGDVWFGADGGLTRFDGNSFINYSMANGLPDSHVRSSAMDSAGNLWFGTLGGGVTRFDGKTFMNFAVAQGLPDNNVWSIAIDSAGKIMFGTNAGLAVLVHFNRNPAIAKERLTRPAQNDLNNDDLKNYTPQFEIYNVSAGYPIKDVNPQSMIEDSKGDLWMSTGAIKTGLIRFDYSSVHKDKEPPVPVLHNVKINNENVCWHDLMVQLPGKDSGKGDPGPHITEEAITFGFVLTEKDRDSMRAIFKGIKFDSVRRFYPIPENLVLPYRHNNISFDFGSIELNSPNLVKYQYILEGYDKQWNPVTNKTTVTFGNIHEGTYVFKLRAQNTSRIWSDPNEYTFQVLPPWYRTWWAYGLYILILSMSVWGFVKLRVMAVKEENKALEKKVISRTRELEQSLVERYRLSKTIESQEALLNERLRISRELHDDIGSTLSSISIYSEVAKNRAEKNEPATEVLSKIGLASRDLIDKMSDIVWSLNPNNETFEQLQNRMMAFAAMMFTPRHIRYDFITDEESKKIRLTGEQRKNLFLIFKEALHNIVKYANCKTVSIRLSADNNDLMMAIKDDGEGFDVSKFAGHAVVTGDESLGGNGFKNMHARAENMNGKLCISTKQNEGTTIQLIVPI